MQTLSVDELMDRGKAVYDSACLACHGAQGEGGIGNAIAGSTVVLGDLSSHMAVVAGGVSGTAMQAFGGQLNDVELAAVLTYQRNAFGNNTGDVVQPGDVAGMKNG
jgi:cytochrome c oxidase subunit 2